MFVFLLSQRLLFFPSKLFRKSSHISHTQYPKKFWESLYTHKKSYKWKIKKYKNQQTTLRCRVSKLFSQHNSNLIFDFWISLSFQVHRVSRGIQSFDSHKGETRKSILIKILEKVDPFNPANRPVELSKREQILYIKNWKCVRRENLWLPHRSIKCYEI